MHQASTNSAPWIWAMISILKNTHVLAAFTALKTIAVKAANMENQKAVMMMETKTAVQNAVWPYLFGTICYEAMQNEDPDQRLQELYDKFEAYLIAWRDELPKHAQSTFGRYLKRTGKELIELCKDAKACDGLGGNSTSKTVGVFKGIMENVTLVKIDGFSEFEKACAELDQLVFEHLGDEYNAQFDSGSIEKKVIKGLKIMKELGYNDR